MNEPSKTAVFGGGCFWCVEAIFLEVPGVVSVESGYAGGSTPSPSYEEVCSGRTGHAEVIRITYDPAAVSYSDLLGVFWNAHDPTTLNRQGADRGTQYRSIILTQSDDELEIAKTALAEAQSQFTDPIVTEIKPLDTFYPAEGYHQNFTANHPSHPYVCAVIAPKLAKFRRTQTSV